MKKYEKFILIKQLHYLIYQKNYLNLKIINKFLPYYQFFGLIFNQNIFSKFFSI